MQLLQGYTSLSNVGSNLKGSYVTPNYPDILLGWRVVRFKQPLTVKETHYARNRKLKQILRNLLVAAALLYCMAHVVHLVSTVSTKPTTTLVRVGVLIPPRQEYFKRDDATIGGDVFQPSAHSIISLLEVSEIRIASLVHTFLTTRCSHGPTESRQISPRMITFRGLCYMAVQTSSVNLTCILFHH